MTLLLIEEGFTTVERDLLDWWLLYEGYVLATSIRSYQDGSRLVTAPLGDKTASTMT